MTTTTPAVATVSGRRPEVRTRSKWSAWFDRWWVPVLVLPLMMASDFKFRHRSAQSTLGGSPDAQILVEIGVYGLVLVYLALARGRAPRLRRTSPLMFTMWFFGTVLAVSSLYAVYPMMSMVRGTQVLIVCALAQTISSRATIADMHRLAHAYMLMMCGAVALGFVWQGEISGHVSNRFHWMYLHPVPGAIYLMTGSLLALGYTRNSELRNVLRLWPAWAYPVVAGWVALGLVLTATRGSIAGYVVGCIVLITLHTRTKTKFDIAVFGTSMIVFIAVAFGSLIVTYLERGEGVGKLATLNERTNLWKLAFAQMAKKPIFGDGLGASRGIFLDSIGLGGGHNAFVNVMVDVGILGTSAFVLLLIFIGRALWRFPRGTEGHRDALLLLPVFCAMLVNSMTAEFMAVPANNASMWLFLFCAWITVDRRVQARAMNGRPDRRAGTRLPRMSMASSGAGSAPSTVVSTNANAIP